MQQLDPSESVSYTGYVANSQVQVPAAYRGRTPGAMSGTVHAPGRQDHYPGPITFMTAHPPQPVAMRMQPHYVDPVYLSQSYLVEPTMPSASHQYDEQGYEQASYGQSAYMHASPMTYTQQGNLVEPSTAYQMYASSAPYYDPNASTPSQTHASTARSTPMN
jgi:hypothetical protein